MTMNFENLIYEVDDQLAIITINRPKKLNALNKETIQELHDAFAEADDDEEQGIEAGPDWQGEHQVDRREGKQDADSRHQA